MLVNILISGTGKGEKKNGEGGWEVANLIRQTKFYFFLCSFCLLFQVFSSVVNWKSNKYTKP